MRKLLFKPFRAIWRWIQFLVLHEYGRVNPRKDGKPCLGIKARRNKITGSVQIRGSLTGMWIEPDDRIQKTLKQNALAQPRTNQSS